MTGRHTGELIGKLIKDVLEDWKITNKTPFAITDNGSNVVKAFKVVQEMFLVDHESSQRTLEPEEGIENNNSTVFSGDNETLDNISVDQGIKNLVFNLKHNLSWIF